MGVELLAVGPITAITRCGARVPGLLPKANSITYKSMGI